MVRFGPSKPDKLGFTEDLSSDGLFIAARIVHAPGTQLQIQLTLPDNRALQMTGQVVWARQAPPQLSRFLKKVGMGVRLVQAPPEYRQYISQLA